MEAQRAAIRAGEIPFRELGGLLGNDSAHALLHGGWIGRREILTNRKWGPVTMAALHVAREAVADAGWSAGDLRNAAIVVGTSRGNAAGWLGPWPGRRPFKLMAASNTIHSEPASAISIELGITGPSHTLASGCAAGLDAIGIAMMLLASGVVARALAVAAELPLVPMLLDNYAASGLLCRTSRLDPYARKTSGFIPAEGAAAVALELHREGFPQILSYYSNSDACDPVGIPADGGRTPDLLDAAIRSHGPPAAVCPHATGTLVQSIAEPGAFRRSFHRDMPTLHTLKPWLGHTIGASGLLESVILARFLRDGEIPPNPPGLAAPSGFLLPDRPISAGGPVYKLSHGMGGHNALLVLTKS